MAIDKLGLYNIAMLALRAQRFDSLTDDRAERYDLDEVYTRGKGAINYLLEQGHWNFAMRAVQIDASTSVTPEFGFTYAFDKPTDFVRLNMISADEDFNRPLDHFEFEGDFIYTNVDPLYVRFVSDDASWGSDFAKWPETFSLWAGHWMATQIGGRHVSDTEMEKIEERTRRLRVDARSKDASQEPPRWPPLSSWASSRLGRSSRIDRGRRGALIG